MFNSLFAAIALVLLFAAPAAAAPLKVVATIAPFADLAQKIGGESVKVYTILKPGRGPHSYEPTPGDARRIASSDVVVMVGLGLDGWLVRLVESAGGSGAVMVDCSLAIVESTGWENERNTKSAHSHHSKNPHYWLDPGLMIPVVKTIRDVFVARAPKEADRFNENTDKLVESLLALDREISDKLKNARGRYVAFHNSWFYFARRYGLKQIGVIEAAPGREPSAKHMAALIDKIKRAKAKAVMVEPQFNRQLGKTLAEEAGVGVAVVDPVGGVEGRRGYFEMMRFNTNSFFNALGEQTKP